MKSFHKEFLHDPLGDEPRLYLAAWGKHPGWNDHMDDLGLETESLVEAKRLLYDRAIGENLGAWDRLSAEQRIGDFRHVFLWRRKNQALIGRMWPSKDGKGRALYPMVVCAHCSGISAKEMIESVSPALEEIEAACIGTKSADQVRLILDDARAKLRGGLAGSEISASEKVSVEKLSAILADIQVRFSSYLQGSYSARKEPAPGSYRFASRAETCEQSLLFWLQFITRYLDADAPAMLFRHRLEQCVDLVVGEPSAKEMFGLRAGLDALPVSNEPAARDDAKLQERARALVDAWLNPAAAEETSTRQRSWFQFLR